MQGSRAIYQADKLAGKADIKQGLTLGTSEVLRLCRKNLRACATQEHHSIERLQERGVHRGSGRWSTLRGRERAILNQTNVGTVSKATLGKLLKNGAERIWAFPSAEMLPCDELNRTELSLLYFVKFCFL